MRKAEKNRGPLHKEEARWRDVDLQRDLQAEVEDARVPGGAAGNIGAPKNVHATGTQGTADKPEPPPYEGDKRAEED